MKKILIKKGNKQVIIKINEKQGKLLNDLLNADKGKYLEVFFESSDKKPKEYNLIKNLCQSFSEVNYVADCSYRRHIKQALLKSRKSWVLRSKFNERKQRGLQKESR